MNSVNTKGAFYCSERFLLLKNITEMKLRSQERRIYMLKMGLCLLKRSVLVNLNPQRRVEKGKEKKKTFTTL